MHKNAIIPLVYAHLYPNPRSGDPLSFQAYISRCLIPEVRSETARFYGQIDCLEAQYPGLDYAKPAHRLRLSLFPNHKRLFQTLDYLRLTEHEIHVLCRWEGTRWARERYEKDENVKVVDTTWASLPQMQPQTPCVIRAVIRGGAETAANLEDIAEEEIEEDDEDEEMEDDEDAESEDELGRSVGLELNERLIAATAARARGEEAVLDPDWEQWLKEAAERGALPELPLPRSIPGLNDTQIRDSLSHAILPPLNLSPSEAAADQATPRVFQSTRMPVPAATQLLNTSAPQPPAGTAM